MTTPATEVPSSPPRRSHAQKLWVPIVLLIGLIVGELISAATVQQPSPPPFGGGGGPYGFYFHHFPTNPLFEYHIVLTTVGVALLAALVVIYVRMYVDTRANFALGLVIVLIALLLQALFSYPITVAAIGLVQFPGSAYLSLAADVVTICAYAIFLYLSLE